VKTRFAVTLAMIAGFGLGILADQPLNAQTTPPAYVVTLFDTGVKSLMDTDYPSLNPRHSSPLAVATLSTLERRLASMGFPRIELSSLRSTA
jgi:hypothetical protein